MEGAGLITGIRYPRSIIRRVRRTDLPEIAVTNLGLAALTALTGIALARTLDESERGVVTLALLWPTIGQLLYGLGIRQAVVYFVSNAPGTRRQVIANASAMSIICGLGLVVTAGAISGAGLVPGDLRESLLIVIVVSPFALHGGVANGVAQALDVRIWSRLRVALPLTYLGGVAFLWSFGLATPSAVAYTYAAAVIVGWAASYWFGLIRPGFHGLGLQWRAIGNLLRYGVWTTLSSALEQVNTRLDLVLLGFVASRGELGVYAVAVGMSQLALPLSSVLAPWLFPKLARSSGGARQRLAAQGIIATLAGSVCVAVPLGVFAPMLITSLLGERWVPAVSPLRILLVGSVFLAMRKVLVSVVSGYGRPVTLVFADGAAAVVTAVLLPPMMSVYGIRGAAAASTVAYGVAVIWMLWKWRGMNRGTGIGTVGVAVSDRLPGVT